MSGHALSGLVAGRLAPAQFRGIASVCSAHPLVIEAALRHGITCDGYVLIEATCNQANQEGGYTGMTPEDFKTTVERTAARVGFDRGRLVLGGDHLGPYPWRSLDSRTAMHRAELMIAAYVKAGYSKLHLDTTMGCANEPDLLEDEQIAERAARLARIAEETAANHNLPEPVYVIGLISDLPGSAHGSNGRLAVTDSSVIERTIDIHRRSFASAGIESASERVIAVVAQPGIGFRSFNVKRYNPRATEGLSDLVTKLVGITFEAHSTDFQTPSALGQLIADGFGILKVGPALTFALREALYGLDHISRLFDQNAHSASLIDTMEELMLANPERWKTFCSGGAIEQQLQRHYSYSDRIRYFWANRDAIKGIDLLMTRLGERQIPEELISQYLGRLSPLVASGVVEPSARSLIIASIRQVLDCYSFACSASQPAMTP